MLQVNSVMTIVNEIKLQIINVIFNAIQNHVNLIMVDAINIVDHLINAENIRQEIISVIQDVTTKNVIEMEVIVMNSNLRLIELNLMNQDTVDIKNALSDEFKIIIVMLNVQQLIVFLMEEIVILKLVIMDVYKVKQGMGSVIIDVIKVINVIKMEVIVNIWNLILILLKVKNVPNIVIDIWWVIKNVRFNVKQIHV